MGKRKTGLLATHKRLIVKLLEREASHHRFHERDCAVRVETDGNRVFGGMSSADYWRKEAADRQRKAELAEDALARLALLAAIAILSGCTNHDLALSCAFLTGCAVGGAAVSMLFAGWWRP